MFVLFFLIAGLSRSSVAGKVSQDKKIVYGWCGKEIYQFCRNARTMPERLRCLESHKARLSGDCRGKVAKAHRLAKGVLNACQRDLSRLCQNQMSSYGVAAQCLLMNKGRLSKSCKGHLPIIQHYAYRSLVLNTCKPQIYSLCDPQDSISEAGVIACLKRNLGHLPPNCQAAGAKAGLWKKASFARAKSQNLKSQIQSLEP